jgi:hypothetical protein
MFRRAGFRISLILIVLAAPAFARGHDISGHYERSGENEQASLDVTTLPGDRVKVSGIALWNTRDEKSGPIIGELEFEAALKDDVVYWSAADGYGIVIRFSGKTADITEHAVSGHFEMNVTFAGHYVRTKAKAAN